MKKRGLLLIISAFLAFTIQAQTMGEPKTGKGIAQQNDENSVNSRKAVGSDLIISPNPLPKSNAIITISATNIDVYSYSVVNAGGQIVELENLSGKPDSDIINLNGAVTVGSYTIRFDTSQGIIMRKFIVI